MLESLYIVKVFVILDVIITVRSSHRDPIWFSASVVQILHDKYKNHFTRLTWYVRFYDLLAFLTSGNSLEYFIY